MGHPFVYSYTLCICVGALSLTPDRVCATFSCIQFFYSIALFSTFLTPLTNFMNNEFWKWVLKWIPMRKFQIQRSSSPLHHNTSLYRAVAQKLIFDGGESGSEKNNHRLKLDLGGNCKRCFDTSHLPLGLYQQKDDFLLVVESAHFNDALRYTKLVYHRS